MKMLTIGDLDEINIVHEKMKDEIDLLLKEGIVVNLNIDQKGKIKTLICEVNENNKFKKNPLNIMNIFRYYTANVIADYIINDKEVKNLEKMIQQQYYYFNPQERKKILDLSIKALNEKEDYYLSTNVYKISKKVRMIEEIVEYMENYNELIIDGFIRFRLKYYVDDLKDAVESGVEDYLMEKEYNEFIRLLQYFVDIQEPKIQTMHILIDENHRYSLLDTNYNYIQNEYLEELATEFLDGEIKYEDLLISSLITIAPTKIYIHHMEDAPNQEIMDTIQKVFSDRVVICSGCEICRGKNIAKKE